MACREASCRRGRGSAAGDGLAPLPAPGGGVACAVSAGGRRSHLQIVYDLLDPRLGSGVAGRRVALYVVVHGTAQGNGPAFCFHAQLLALQTGIRGQLGLDVAGKLGVIRGLGATHANRKNREQHDSGDVEGKFYLHREMLLVELKPTIDSLDAETLPVSSKIMSGQPADTRPVTGRLENNLGLDGRPAPEPGSPGPFSRAEVSAGAGICSREWKQPARPIPDPEHPSGE